MILRENVVIDGQTFFSGERMPEYMPTGDLYDMHANVQKPMTWLSKHQTQLKIKKELRQEHILSQHKSSIGTSGDIKP